MICNAICTLGITFADVTSWIETFCADMKEATNKGIDANMEAEKGEKKLVSADPNSSSNHPNIHHDQASGEEQLEMQRIMGFAAFDSSKGKRASSNENSESVFIPYKPKRQYRQFLHKKRYEKKKTPPKTAQE